METMLCRESSSSFSHFSRNSPTTAALFRNDDKLNYEKSFLKVVANA
jgi:hypothetical protein